MIKRLSILLLVVLVLPFANIARAQTISPFLQIAGTGLAYQGQPVLLRGENSPNLPALGAAIGSGKLSSMNADESDYAQMQAMGGNHIRLGLSFGWYTADRTAFFVAIDQQVAWARAHHQWLVPVMFTTPGNCYEGYGHTCGIWSSSSEQQQLIAFWQDFAAHYASEPTVAGYDLLNEPTAPSSGTWLTLAEKICTAIATVDSNHFVVVESLSDPHFPRLVNCPRVLYSVHLYAPVSLTTGGRGTYPGAFTEWNGQTYQYNRNTILNDTNPLSLTNFRLRYSVNWAAANSVPLYVGEYGCLSSASGCNAWVQDVTDALKVWSVSYSHYAIRHNATSWGIFNMSGPLLVPGTAQTQILYNELRADDSGSVQPDSNIPPVPTIVVALPTISPTPTPPPTNTPSPAPTQPVAVPTLTPLPCPSPTQIGSFTDSSGIRWNIIAQAVC